MWIKYSNFFFERDIYTMKILIAILRVQGADITTLVVTVYGGWSAQGSVKGGSPRFSKCRFNSLWAPNKHVSVIVIVILAIFEARVT